MDHVGYSLTCSGRDVYSSCPAFTDKDREFVPARAILRGCNREEGQTTYEFVRGSLESFGVEDCTTFLDRMTCTDFIIANEDRHFGNFGIIRDPESLEIKGFAPMFDNGTSLGSRSQTAWIENGYDIRCKPFMKTHEEQIGLAGSFDWLNLDRLDGIEGFAMDVFHETGRLFDEYRAKSSQDSCQRGSKRPFDHRYLKLPLIRDSPVSHLSF